MGIILASASPRRRELLTMLGLRDFKIIPAETDEETAHSDPGDAVRHIALVKARKVALSSREDDLVIAADTLVYLDGEAMGKPRDEDEARAMLERLSGARHSVYTGVAIVRGRQEMTFAEKSEVYFRTMSEGEIAAYVRTGEPMDKAGAYGVQGRGAVFIERIDGDFFNVMGLPLCRLVTALRRFGLDLTENNDI
jgi:septum formation protein